MKEGKRKMFTRWTRLLAEVEKAREHDPGYKVPERKAKDYDNKRTKSRKNKE